MIKSIPQFEFAACADSFNLAGEVAKTPAPVTPKREDNTREMFNLNDIKQSNARLKFAIALHRINQDTESKSEIYDALNARHTMRNAKLTQDEANALRLNYLRDNAPDLIHHH